MKKWIFGTALVLAAAVAVFVWYQTAVEDVDIAPAARTAPAPMVQVMPVPVKSFAAKLELTGSVEPLRIAQLASTAEGVAKKVLVREGDQVSTGVLLASIARKGGVDALIDSLSRELAQEEDNLLRLITLVDAGALPAEQLEQAGLAREKIHVQLINAREAARDYDLRAPWSGIVSRVQIKEGELVAPRTPLVEIYDPASLMIQTAVPERYAVAMSIGMAVEIKLDAYPGQVFGGQIVQVFPLLDARLRTRTIQIALDQRLSLLPGMFARLDIILESVADVPGVPTHAVLPSPQGPVVFVVEDDKAHRRKVETGIEDGGFIQIKQGVDVGETLIVAGAENLKDGASVTVRAAGSGQSSTKGAQ
jgi:membrane fusion protein (multidrug efflux system)